MEKKQKEQKKPAEGLKATSPQTTVVFEVDRGNGVERHTEND